MANTRHKEIPTSKGLRHEEEKLFLRFLMESVIFYSVWRFFSTCAAIVAKLIIPLNTSYYDDAQRKGASMHEESMLFPSIDWHTMEVTKNSMVVGARPCSTEIGTKFTPVDNGCGEIEWKFTDDSKAQAGAVEKESNEAEPEEKFGANLSPTASNTSNAESVMSEEKLKNLDKDASPGSTSASSLYASPENEVNGKASEGEDGKSYNCPHCEASFKIRGYLTRHIKKHALKKAYTCPFHKFSIFVDENNVTHKCHPTGGFSRRDTYKTHLKSRHFKYPKGTKTKDRSNTPGHCSMCGEYFQNSEIWSEIHIEGCECKYLPAGFKGKSIIKNRLRKQLSKQKSKGAEFNLVDTSNFSDIKSGKEHNQMSIDHNLMTYDYANVNSPTFSVSSSTEKGPQNPSSASVTPEAYRTKSPLYVHQREGHSQEYNIHGAKRNAFVPFTANQSMEYQESYEYNRRSADVLMKNSQHDAGHDDYDDEFCLDVDQLDRSSLYQQDIGNFIYQNQADMNYLDLQRQDQRQHVQY